MDQREWSQPELARRSRVSQAHISKILTGISTPTVDKVEMLAAAFRIDPMELMRTPGTQPDLIRRFERFLIWESSGEDEDRDRI